MSININKNRNKNYWILFICVSIIFLFSLPKGHAQELGKYIEQFEGKNGATPFKVKLLRIGSKDKEEVLIQFSGVDDPLNGKIYRYKKVWLNKEKRFNKYQYVTDQIPGKKEFASVFSDNEYGEQIFKVFLLDNPTKEITIHPKTYQENLDPNFMYEEYLRQRE